MRKEVRRNKEYRDKCHDTGRRKEFMIKVINSIPDLEDLSQMTEQGEVNRLALGGLWPERRKENGFGKRVKTA
jgi:hypothetical protein